MLPPTLRRPRWILTVDWLERANGREKLHSGVVLGPGFVKTPAGTPGATLLKIFEPEANRVILALASRCRVIGATTEDAAPGGPTTVQFKPETKIEDFKCTMKATMYGADPSKPDAIVIEKPEP